MPTQDFVDELNKDADSQLEVRVAWDFAYEHVFLQVNQRTFQLHDLDELRTNGVRLTVDDDEFFVYLAGTRDGERFKVSVHERPLTAGVVDFANAMSPDRPLVLSRAATTNRPAPSKIRWVMHERVERARRWCRTMSAGAASVAFLFASNFPAALQAQRRGTLLALAGFSGLLLLVDLISRTDRGARFALFVGFLSVPPAFVGTTFGFWRFHLGGLPLLSPQSFLYPALLGLHGVLAQKTLAGRTAAAWLYADARDRRRRT